MLLGVFFLTWITYDAFFYFVIDLVTYSLSLSSVALNDRLDKSIYKHDGVYWIVKVFDCLIVDTLLLDGLLLFIAAADAVP